MRLVAVNGSPRRQWNTAQLLEKICEGAAACGAETELVHLRDLTCRGCISCFHCKDPNGKSYGRCILKDDLTTLLDSLHTADVVVLGSPIYWGAESSLMRMLMERFFFQYLRYSKIKPPLSPRKKATALVYTMGIPQDALEDSAIRRVINTSESVMERFFGSCELLLCCDTLQFSNYSKYDTDMFNADAKQARHEEIFPREMEEAFSLGQRLVS